MKRKILLNSVSSLLVQLVTVISGLILPRLILGTYGSAVNGLTNSIAQFLGVVSLLELGVGQVIQSALYKPLSEKNIDKISSILASGQKFFRRIAFVLLMYVVLLMGIYPIMLQQDFGWIYTATLIGAISISNFAQYYFGIIDNILLNSDQRGYIHYISRIGGLILNTVVCVVLIRVGASIQFVKLTSSCVFLIRPIVVRVYVNKRYRVNRNIKYIGEPIKQKWNGIAQHMVAFVLDGTDNIVLTLLSTLANVSIYSVYHMVIYGIRRLYQTTIVGIQSAMGALWAKQDMKKLNEIFGCVETGLHFATVFLFSCTGILVIPFVKVYTNGIIDVDYVQPLFAFLMVVAHASVCLRSPYYFMILAGGHYKQTQRCHVVAAVLNLVISVATVSFLGLIGVALGTLVAMIYQTIWMAIYNSKNLIKWSIMNFVKQIVVDMVTVVLIYISTLWIDMDACNYLSFIFMALKVAIIAFVIIVIAATVFFRERLIHICRLILKKG